jgi:hypothetical protein
MSVSPDVLLDIANSSLQFYIDKGKLTVQNVSNKPMLRDFNANSGTFPGGNEYVSVGVKDGRSGAGLQGYSFDDQVTYYDPAVANRARFPWKEHHIGVTLTHTELKRDGINVTEDGTDQTTGAMDGREQFAIANRFEEVLDTLGEDYSWSMDRLLHGDGTTDTKALAGIGALLLPSPSAGSSGGISRTAFPYWRNRAATAANAGAGGQGAITSSSTAGGALIAFLEKEWIQLARYRRGGSKVKIYCGSDFLQAYKQELRANGTYTMNGWRSKTADGAMGDAEWFGTPLEYDPTMDDLGLSKRCYVIDMSRNGIQLLYMDGNKMKKHNPARPFDRYVIYQGITTTAVLVAKQLNTSAVYDIA